MTAHEPRILDVRPILAAGGEPLALIMDAVAGLSPGQCLLLRAPFKPAPLFAIMQGKGFDHCERAVGGDEWEILFTPMVGGENAVPRIVQPIDPGTMPQRAPDRKLDNRGLAPPDPLIRTLQTLEEMSPGEWLEVINDRDPIFLYPELAERGHSIRAVPAEGEWFALLIQHSGAKEDGV